jgi:NADH-quinone oxidoreductase subunit H
LLQPVADGVKLIFKEELIPDQADRTLFLLAPVITVVPALIIVAVVPLGPEVQLFGRTFVLGLADTVNVGVLYIMAVSSIAVYGIALAGWSSGNKYSTMGALRASAQMVSYELALGLAFLGPILLADSLSLREIVNDQSRFLSWYALRQPVGLFVFLVASIAELNRAPFDLPEAEQELTAGYHTEYSGMKFAMFYMAEYIKMIAVSAIAASLFLGGFWGPGVERVPWLGPVYLSLKIGLILFGMIWIRATLPRLRYDQLMTYGWKVLLPLGLLNLAWTAIWVVWKG